MKRNVLLSLLISLCVLISSCDTFDPVTLLKANSQVQEFLNQYPNADITMIKITEANIPAENANVKEICGIELEAKPHYKVTMMDPDSSLDIYAYIDIDTQEVICLKKVGKQAEEKTKEESKEGTEEKNKEETKEQEKSQEKESEKTKELDKETAAEKEVYSGDCDEDITLEGEIIDNKIKLEWSKYECSDLLGYKVVFSDSVEWPKYPENDYIKYITDKNVNSFEDKIRADKSYYSITVLTNTGKIYSNPVTLTAEDYEEPTGDETEIDYECSLEYELSEDDTKLVLSWTEYTDDDLAYYKVVWSQENPELQYPDDGYITVISDKSTVTYEVPAEKFKQGTNYYRISVIRNGFDSNSAPEKRINSNVVEIEK
ncbi:hypothetical protein JXB41_02650 [Candidatus Woesearchaeota archaeon]|nr:hypothetical protein [Candidatus Woesearchaeota archaeon]